MKDTETRPKNGKKKFPRWAKIAIIVVLVLLGLFIAGVIYVNSKLNLINKVDTSETSYIPRSEETFEVDDPDNVSEDTIDAEDINWDNVDIDVMQDENVKNILLIGQDTRGEGRARSDSMIIASINKETKKITLVSVMRDLYVPIPGYSDNRINASYQFGGMELLDQVMAESLGVKIDGNIEVDFEGFINAFTEIGNLDIELYQAEADYLNENNGWNLKEGVNSMTPEQLLAYSRTRYVGHSDWERTDRQRRVLMAAFESLKGKSITELLDLADKIFPYLTTDMTNTEILGYVYNVVVDGMSLGENYRIPVEGTYTCETLRAGMEVLVPDLNENAEYIKQYLYGE